jgi:outer membrane protein OmpA-like peptidoglycan-associated protein
VSNDHASRAPASGGGSSTSSTSGSTVGKSSSTSRLNGGGGGGGGGAAGAGLMSSDAYAYSPGSSGGAAGGGGGDDAFSLHLGGGQSLPESNRASAEQSLGVDLSGVRVHTGEGAAESAAGLNAKAYTAGSDIVFGAGSYAPGTSGGDHLIAHELVHVAQQSAAPAAGPQLKSVTDAHEPAEVEADRGADAIVSGQSFAVQERPTGIPRLVNAPESLSGNPAERGSAGGAAGTTTHRAPTIGDAANAPAAPAAPHGESRAANVKVNAPKERPLHFANPVCPDPARLYEEGPAVTPAPPDFTAVTGFSGSADLPMVEQGASPGIYINGQPTPDDVQQGGIGDCYCEAAIMSMAQRDPGKIKAMMTPDGTGGATVKLWRRQAHQKSLGERIFGGGDQYDYTPVNVAVTADLAVNVSNNRVHGAQLRAAPAPNSIDYWAEVKGSTLEVHRKDLFEVARWAPLLEKAYARFAQQHGQEGGFSGVGSGAAAGTPGYDGINSGFSQYCLRVFYGPASDASGAISMEGMTAAPTAGNNILATNPAVVDRLLTLAQRPDAPRPTDTDAPILTAFTDPDRQITNLGAAITTAMADADYANLSAAVRTKITTLQTAIATYTATAPDAAGVTGGPKALAKQAVGNAAVEVARTPNEEHLATLRTHAPNPVQFDQKADAPQAAFVPRLEFFGRWLEWVSNNSLTPFIVNYVGHASSEGTEENNQALSETRANNTDAAWRKVHITVEANGSNEMFDGGRAGPIRAMMDLVLNVRNLGTDNSSGQRNVYASHAYSVVGISFTTTTGVPVPLQTVSQAQRAPFYPLVDCDVSTVRLRNPHHGNEPDRRGMNQPTRPGDGAPSGPTSDGSFGMSVNEFFRNFNFLETAVMPRTT